MKLNKFFMGILGALALTACSSEEPAPGGSVLPDEGESRYISVSIRNTNTGTRADDAIYEAGYEAENDVKSLRFYFFKENGDPAPITFGGANYYDCDPEKGEIKTGDPSSAMDNVERILQAVIVINTNTANGSREDIKQMVALINFDGLDETQGFNKGVNLSLSQLTSIVNNEEAARKNGFLMTSSSFYAESHGIAVEIKDTDIKATVDLAKANPVDVYVERLLAKVRVSTMWDETMQLVSPVTFNGVNNYVAVALKDKDDKPILNGNRSDDPQIYAIFQTWDLWWTAQTSNLYKKVDDWNLGWIWNDATNHRSYWAENPENVVLNKHNHMYPSRKFGKGSDSDYADYTAYCLENAADFNNSGLKKWYDPDHAVTNRTLVYLKATLVTLEGNVAKEVDLAEWAGYKYTKETVLTAMFEPNVNEFYFLHTDESKNPPVTDENGNVIESGSTSYTFIPVKESDLELVSGKMAGIADDASENSGRYLSYLNLIPEGKGLWDDKVTEDGQTLPVVAQLFKKTDGVDANGKPIFVKVDVEAANSQLESVGGTKVWDGGNTYYYHEIKHLGKTGVDNNSKDFDYGVVRNHIYDVQINSVTGLGTPVLKYKDENGNDVWEDIIPQKPTPDAYYLGARVNILSWRVVPNDVELEW